MCKILTNRTQVFSEFQRVASNSTSGYTYIPARFLRLIDLRSLAPLVAALYGSSGKTH